MWSYYLHMTEKNMWFWICVNSLTTLSFVFLTLAILTGVKRNLKVVLIYIFLIQRMFNTFLGILFTICVFSFENYLFSLLSHLAIRWSGLECLVLWLLLSSIQYSSIKCTVSKDFSPILWGNLLSKILSVTYYSDFLCFYFPV